MRWAATLATAGLAELMARFLGLTWGFMVLVAAFVFIAVRVSATMAAATSKAANTEARLAAHITAAAPAINLVANGGTVNGNLSVAGTLAANASGSAEMEIGGNGHITGGLEVDGSLITSTGGSIPQGRPSNAGTYTGGSPTGTGNLAAWAASVTTIVNDTIAQLVSAGVLS